MRRCLLWLIAGPAWCACLEVAGGTITAGDLAKAIPELRQIPAESKFGFAPLPGLVRHLTAGEIDRFAARHGLAVKAPTICIESPVHVLPAEQVRAALVAAVPGAAEIELLEHSNSRVPPGPVVFPVSGISPAGAQGTSLCRGYVLYETNRRAAVWAKARIFILRNEAIAARELAPGSVLTPADVRPVTRRAPYGSPTASNVIGLAATRHIPANAVIDPAWLRTPDAIKAGDPVKVSVGSGAARVEFTAKALSSAPKGQLVRLASPINRKTLTARATAPGSAVIELRGDAQ